MTTVNRRAFLSGIVQASGVLMLAGHQSGCSPEEKGTSTGSVTPYDVMREVMKYRKIDSHAHVYFSPESPKQQLDLADRLGIEKLVVSRPNAAGQSRKTR